MYNYLILYDYFARNVGSIIQFPHPVLGLGLLFYSADRQSAGKIPIDNSCRQIILD
jgi:hypothetical protein